MATTAEPFFFLQENLSIELSTLHKHPTPRERLQALADAAERMGLESLKKEIASLTATPCHLRTAAQRELLECLESLQIRVMVLCGIKYKVHTMEESLILRILNGHEKSMGVLTERLLKVS